MHHIHKTTVIALALLGLYALGLFAVGITLDAAANERLFSETGWIETLSIVFWVIAAIIPLLYIRQAPRRSLLFALLFALFAMREADLHKVFTSANMLKLTYYTHGMQPEQWMVLPFALIIIAVFVACGIEILGYLWRGGLLSRSGQVLLLASLTMVGAKVMDRLPAVLRDEFHIFMFSSVREVLLALEEGLEMASPLVFICAFLLVPNLLESVPQAKHA